MVDFFCAIYGYAHGDNNWFNRFRLYSVFRYIIRIAANAVLPVYFRMTARSKRNRLLPRDIGSNDYRLVVSLTSFPARIDTVWMSVETLMRQSVKPDAIILWLSRDQFGNESDLPESLLKMVSRGLRIEFRDGDMRSHKKYFYARHEFPNAVLVLADDDIFYPKTMLSDLLALSAEHEGRVVCRFARGIRWGGGWRAIAIY